MSTVFDAVAAFCAKKGAKFVGFTYRTKGTGELQKVVVIVGASTDNLYSKDIEILEQMVQDSTGVELIAAQELLASRLNSKANGIGHNDGYTCEDVYTVVNGNTQGVKMHKENGDLHIVGLQEHKTVLEPGVYKERQSSEKTIAKNKIRALLPSSRFRQYRLSNLLRATVNGETLEIEGDIKVDHG
jgi:hypothetical protein